MALHSKHFDELVLHPECCLGIYECMQSGKAKEDSRWVLMQGTSVSGGFTDSMLLNVFEPEGAG